MPTLPLQAGQLNRPITIEAVTPAGDGSGGSTHTTILQCFAGIRAANGKDVYAASGFVEQISHVVTLRWVDAGIASGQRVLYGTRSFRIQAVSDPDEGRKQLNLLCLEEGS